MNKILKGLKEVIMNPAMIVTILIIAFLVYKRLMLTSATEIASLIQNTEYAVIDVRTFSEFESGHVDKAINIPLGTIGSQPPELPKDKEVTIFLYCASGARSGSAVSVLKNAGYSSVHNLGSISRADSLLKKLPQK